MRERIERLQHFRRAVAMQLMPATRKTNKLARSDRGTSGLRIGIDQSATGAGVCLQQQRRTLNARELGVHVVAVQPAALDDRREQFRVDPAEALRAPVQ